VPPSASLLRDSTLSGGRTAYRLRVTDYGFLVPGSWLLVPGSRFLVPGSWFPVPGKLQSSAAVPGRL